MKTNVLNQVSWIILLSMTAVFGQCRRGDEEIRKYFASLTWGFWRLQDVTTPGQVSTPASSLGYDQYLERKYNGWTVTGPDQRTEIDSVLLYKDRQVVFATRVAEVLSSDVDKQKIVYRLNNNQYYWVQFIGVEGPEDGTGNDQLLVSDFVNSLDALDGAAVFRYERTNSGHKPW